MLPWEHDNFTWVTENPRVPLIIEEFIEQPWSWGKLKGDGFWWNLSQPGVFRIYIKNFETDYLGWEPLILHETCFPEEVLRALGWSPIHCQDENNEWWQFVPDNYIYQWGVISRTIESSCHVPSITYFQDLLEKHLEQYPPHQNEWNSVPINPYLKTIWHSIWGIWLVSSPNLDELRIQFHLEAIKRLSLDSLLWVDCFGNSWFHECARTIYTIKGWESAIFLASNVWGTNFTNYPRNIELETAFDILNKRRYDEDAPSWIEEWFEKSTNLNSPTNVIL